MNIDNPGLNQELINTIKELINEKNVTKEQLNELNKIAQQFKDLPIPYSAITRCIYEAERENEDAVNALSDYVRPYLTENGSFKNSNPLAKIYEHISLADTQFKYLPNEKKISDLNSMVSKVNRDVENYITKIDDRINGVYAGFVSVLGIFISISFTLFGGVNILNTLFSNIKNSSNSSTGKAIVLAGIATLLIYLLSFTLLNGIQRLANRFGFRPAPWDDYIMSNRREDLRYRNLFIVLSIGIGIIIFGSKYGEHWSIILGIPFNSFTVMIPYALVCLLILKHGVFIRRLVTNHYSRWGEVYTFKRTLEAVRRRIGSIEILEMIIGIPSLIVLIYSV